MGGNPRQLRFDQFTLKAFYKKVDFEFFEASSVPACVFAALKSYDYAKGNPSDYTWEQVYEWTDAMSVEDKKRVKDAFEAMESYKESVKNLKTVLTDLTKEEAKKKSTTLKKSA